MKIHSTPVMTPVERLQGNAARPSVESAERSERGDDVRVVGGARFVSEVRASAALFSEVRASEVVRARDDLASGELMTDAEIEAAVDSLLAGL